MRYHVRARMVLMEPPEEIPMVASVHKLKFLALLASRGMNRLDSNYTVQWYVLDTQTGKTFV